jgi:ribosomal protein S12 methylthiotransferase
MSQPAVSMVSLGCAKNLVDSERMLGALVERGWLVAARPQEADVVLINTCGFIEEARAETFGIIEEALALKGAGVVEAVVVVGCLVQLMGPALARRFEAVDAWVGLSAPDGVVRACERALTAERPGAVETPPPSERPLDSGPRLRVTPRHYAYLRIAEGCDNRCHYCQIPRIRGPLRSRPMDAVLAEADELIADGARELILIGQDTTSYGRDLGGEPRLADLLRRLRGTDGLRWLRLMYTHPAHLGEGVIGVLREGRPLLPYVDLPVQHASDAILERMGRPTSRADLTDLVGRIRDAVPGVVLRTSVIVGFPGETEAEFAELLDFIRKTRFERLGAFAYSAEEGTPSAELPGPVPDEVKEERLSALMELQEEIADEQSRALVGTEIDVVVDGRGFDGEWAGRTVRDAPEVDGSIKFEDTGLEPGRFGRARVSEAYGYDLVGRMTVAEREDGF